MNSEIMEVINLLSKERGISKEALISAIEAALIAGAKQHFGKADNVKVVFNHDTCEYRLYRAFTVVRDDDYVDPATQITKTQLKEKYGVKLKYGEEYLVEFESKDFGRIAAQNGKNVIQQKLREEERKSIYDRFAEKEHEVVSGVISRVGAKGLTVNLGKADALVPEVEQVKSEHYREGDRLKVYILEVKETSRAPKILASRSHPEFVKKLFEAEVAEMQNGTVEVMAIAREAGSRTKMAVWSNDANVEPVGACIGTSGIRVGAIVNELSGEKIDIINWSEEPAELIENAISPAKVICVLADEEEKEAIVVVPDYQLSLAIGKAGQNARLVAKLTGFKVDIKSETQARESGLFEEIGYIDDYYVSEEEGEYEAEEGEEYEEEVPEEGYTAEPDEE